MPVTTRTLTSTPGEKRSNDRGGLPLLCAGPVAGEVTTIFRDVISGRAQQLREIGTGIGDSRIVEGRELEKYGSALVDALRAIAGDSYADELADFLKTVCEDAITKATVIHIRKIRRNLNEDSNGASLCGRQRVFAGRLTTEIATTTCQKCRDEALRIQQQQAAKWIGLAKMLKEKTEGHPIRAELGNHLFLALKDVATERPPWDGYRLIELAYSRWGVLTGVMEQVTDIGKRYDISKDHVHALLRDVLFHSARQAATSGFPSGLAKLWSGASLPVGDTRSDENELAVHFLRSQLNFCSKGDVPETMIVPSRSS